MQQTISGTYENIKIIKRKHNNVLKVMYCSLRQKITIIVNGHALGESIESGVGQQQNIIMKT
jgi:hypothetical protein